MLLKSISPHIWCVLGFWGGDCVLPVSDLVHSLCCFLADICLFPMVLCGEVGSFVASVNGCWAVYPPPRFIVHFSPRLKSSTCYQLFSSCIWVGIRLSTVTVAMWQPCPLEKIGEVRRSNNCYTHTNRHATLITVHAIKLTGRKAVSHMSLWQEANLSAKIHASGLHYFILKEICSSSSMLKKDLTLTIFHASFKVK